MYENILSTTCTSILISIVGIHTQSSINNRINHKVNLHRIMNSKINWLLEILTHLNIALFRPSVKINEVSSLLLEFWKVWSKFKLMWSKLGNNSQATYQAAIPGYQVEGWDKFWNVVVALGRYRECAAAPGVFLTVALHNNEIDFMLTTNKVLTFHWVHHNFDFFKLLNLIEVKHFSLVQTLYLTW